MIRSSDRLKLLILLRSDYSENLFWTAVVWFLNHSNKAVAQLFRDTLLELIGQKGITRFEFEGDFWAEREYYTPKGNRIDIVMQTTEANKQINVSSADSAAIVIENKIFHFLSNDLQDYLNAVSANRKAGVLLTLRKEAIPEHVKEYFVNITHAEWCSAIQQKGIPHTLTPKEFIYLTDFLSHMTDIVNSQQSEEARFFFDHSEKILKAVDVHNKAWDYLILQLKYAATKLNYELSGSANGYRHIWDDKNDSDVYYTILIGKALSTAPEITIILEVYRNGLKFKDEIDKNMAANNYFELDKGANEASDWKHIAGKTYPISRENWNSLGDFIYDKIEEDFEAPMKLLIEIIYRK
jgi:hypothetical protein